MSTAVETDRYRQRINALMRPVSDPVVIDEVYNKDQYDALMDVIRRDGPWQPARQGQGARDATAREKRRSAREQRDGRIRVAAHVRASTVPAGPRARQGVALTLGMRDRPSPGASLHTRHGGDRGQIFDVRAAQYGARNARFRIFPAALRGNVDTTRTSRTRW